MRQKTLAQKEQEKAAQTLPEMVKFLMEHADRHTPFMDRWLELCISHETQIYPVHRVDGAEGRRVRHGKPARVIEFLESAARFGKKDVWFCKVVA